MAAQVKLLIPNKAVGCVIGKQGSTISEVQLETSTTVIISRSNSFYPDSVGNQDRVVLVQGSSVEDVLKAVRQILEKVKEEGEEFASMVRLLVHTKLCGCIIGKSGITIKSMQSDACKVVVGAPPARVLGLHERVVTCSCPDKNIDVLMDRVRLILSKIVEEESDLFAATVDDCVNYGDSPVGTQSVADRKKSHTIIETLLVPESRVGAIIGKHGRFMGGIQELLGVSMTISEGQDSGRDKEDHSLCTISGGSEDVVQIARQIVQMKIDRVI